MSASLEHLDGVCAIAIFLIFVYSMAMQTLPLHDIFAPECVALVAMRRALIALLFSMAALWGESAAGGEIDSRELQRILAERRGALGIQTEFPPEPSSRRSEGYAVRGSPASPMQVSPMAASTMLWIAVGVFLAVVLLTGYQNLRIQSKGNKAEKREGRARTDEVRTRMNVAREESDVLAERGDYAAAMHVLLLKSVEEMRRRLDISIAQSLTSREILVRSGLEPDAGACLGDIVQRVEISWFGPHLPGADDYARCRESFVALTGFLGRGGRG